MGHLGPGLGNGCGFLLHVAATTAQQPRKALVQDFSETGVAQGVDNRVVHGGGLERGSSNTLERFHCVENKATAVIATVTGGDLKRRTKVECFHYVEIRVTAEIALMTCGDPK